jgi:hypothetical protein
MSGSTRIFGMLSTVSKRVLRWDRRAGVEEILADVRYAVAVIISKRIG